MGVALPASGSRRSAAPRRVIPDMRDGSRGVTLAENSMHDLNQRSAARASGRLVSATGWPRRAMRCPIRPFTVGPVSVTTVGGALTLRPGCSRLERMIGRNAVVQATPLVRGRGQMYSYVVYARINVRSMPDAHVTQPLVRQTGELLATQRSIWVWDALRPYSGEAWLFEVARDEVSC